MDGLDRQEMFARASDSADLVEPVDEAQAITRGFGLLSCLAALQLSEADMREAR